MPRRIEIDADVSDQSRQRKEESTADSLELAEQVDAIDYTFEALTVLGDSAIQYLLISQVVSVDSAAHQEEPIFQFSPDQFVKLWMNNEKFRIGIELVFAAFEEDEIYDILRAAGAVNEKEPFAEMMARGIVGNREEPKEKRKKFRKKVGKKLKELL